jgi:ribosomal protein L31E
MLARQVMQAQALTPALQLRRPTQVPTPTKAQEPVRQVREPVRQVMQARELMLARQGEQVLMQALQVRQLRRQRTYSTTQRPA